MTDIRQLSSPAEVTAVAALFDYVWGTSGVVRAELMRAVAHSGGYVAGAFDSDAPDARLVGASFGFLARHHGEPALHSHVTGVLPGLEHAGVGRRLKRHQRQWAAANGCRWVTWTFDPLVRRNAWFNLQVLGAEVAGYLVDFYGSLDDAINTADETDRLLVIWDTAATDETSGEAARDEPSTAGATLVRTPVDIVAVRGDDPAAAAQWRQRLRDQLTSALDSGQAVVGFTRAGEYVLRPR